MKRGGGQLLVLDNEECEVVELSVGYDTKPVVDAIGQVCGFLERRNVDRVSVMAVNICCEELMLTPTSPTLNELLFTYSIMDEE